MAYNLLTNTGFHELEMFIVDVLRYDIEQVDSILNLLNNDGCIGWRQNWPHDFSGIELVPSLQKLIDEGLVDVYEQQSGSAELTPVDLCEGWILPTLDGYWFLLTEKGKNVWESWEPPVEE